MWGGGGEMVDGRLSVTVNFFAGIERCGGGVLFLIYHCVRESIQGRVKSS